MSGTRTSRHFATAVPATGPPSMALGGLSKGRLALFQGAKRASVEIRVGRIRDFGIGRTVPLRSCLRERPQAQRVGTSRPGRFKPPVSASSRSSRVRSMTLSNPSSKKGAGGRAVLLHAGSVREGAREGMAVQRLCSLLRAGVRREYGCVTDRVVRRLA